MGATTEKKSRALAPAPEPDAEPAQLVFAGMPAGDQTAKLTGPITLPGEMLSGLTLGQVVHLHVTAIVTGVAGRAQRTEWGDDVVDVAWKLVVEEATVA